jgi:multidrug efflux pump subunit AcrB
VSAERKLGPAGNIAHAFISSKLTPLIILASLAAGVFSVWKLPREEEPQIKVPMIDVFVAMPGATAREVEERVTKPMEKLLHEIPGVEYIYSTSSPGQSLAIVRFQVGQDEETSIVRLNQKMFANFDLIPPGASLPLIKPRSIDDVPILALTLSSKRYGAYELRQVAAQLLDPIKQVEDVSQVTLIGGQRRELRVVLDDARLAAYALTPMQVMQAIGAGNRRQSAGSFSNGNRETVLQAGDFLRTADDARSLAVGLANSKPVFLRDIATVTDGGEEPTQYVHYGTREGFAPAVTIAISKRKGSQCHHRRRRRVASRGTAARAPDPRGYRSQRHAAVRRDRRGKVQRVAVAHAVRGARRHRAGCLDLGTARVGHRLHGHSGDSGADPHRLLPLWIHPESHHAVCADLLDRHPGGRRDRGG